MTKRLRKHCAIVMSLGAVALASPSFAQDEKNGGASLLRALDANGDGALDKSEIAQATSSIKKLDKNRDGKISKDEMGRSAPSSEGEKPRRGFELLSLDKDGDGKISKEEAPERMKERFGRMDQNGDGFIDKAEQEQVARFLRKRMEEGGGGKGKRRPARDDGQGGSVKPKRPQSVES